MPALRGLLECAVFNCAAAGVHPQRVYDLVTEILGSLVDKDAADAALRAAPVAGRG